MREYSAITASTADASSLADQLTEQSRHGWELVEIVRADNQVVAYLSRESSSANSAGGSSSDPVSTGGSTGGAYATTSGTSQGTSDAQTSASSVPAGGYRATETTVAAVDNAGNAVVTDETVVTPTSDGWGAGSATSGAVAEGFAGQASDSAQQASHTAQHAAADASGQASNAADASGASVPNAPSDGSAQPSGSDASASAGFAPAGWYADPAGRYDLRYWDGAQWTEHVARNGHQETDPPVRG